MMYNRARYYDTSTGEFCSRDALEYVDGMSMMRGYLSLDLADPDGLYTCKCSCVSSTRGGVLREGGRWNAEYQLDPSLSAEYASKKCAERCSRLNSTRGGLGDPIVRTRCTGAIIDDNEPSDPVVIVERLCQILRYRCNQELDDPAERKKCIDTANELCSCLDKAQKKILEIGRPHNFDFVGPICTTCTEKVAEECKGVVGYFYLKGQKEYWDPTGTLGHVWDVIVWRPSGEAVATIDCWGDIDVWWRRGKDGFGYTHSPGTK